MPPVWGGDAAQLLDGIGDGKRKSRYRKPWESPTVTGSEQCERLEKTNEWTTSFWKECWNGDANGEEEGARTKGSHGIRTIRLGSPFDAVFGSFSSEPAASYAIRQCDLVRLFRVPGKPCCHAWTCPLTTPYSEQLLCRALEGWSGAGAGGSFNCCQARCPSSNSIPAAG